MKDDESTKAPDWFLKCIEPAQPRAQFPAGGAVQQVDIVAWLNTATGDTTTHEVAVMDWDDENEPVQSLMTVEQHAHIVAAMLAAPHPVSGEQKPDMADAYCGAMEDRNIWKRRALEAEAKLRTYDQRIVDLGVLSMRTAVEKDKQPAAQDVRGLCEMIDDVCEWFELRGLHELNIYKALKEASRAQAQGGAK